MIAKLIDSINERVAGRDILDVAQVCADAYNTTSGTKFSASRPFDDWIRFSASPTSYIDVQEKIFHDREWLAIFVALNRLEMSTK